MWVILVNRWLTVKSQTKISLNKQEIIRQEVSRHSNKYYNFPTNSVGHFNSIFTRKRCYSLLTDLQPSKNTSQNHVLIENINVCYLFSEISTPFLISGFKLYSTIGCGEQGVRKNMQTRYHFNNNNHSGLHFEENLAS